MTVLGLGWSGYVVNVVFLRRFFGLVMGAPSLKAIDHSSQVEATLRHDLEDFTETMDILSLSTPQ